MFKGSFTDGNNQKVSVGDEVEYRFGERRGRLIDALQDGDAEVLFFDSMQYEMVKWKNLCKVPTEFETKNSPKPLFDIDTPQRNSDWLIV